MKTLSLVSILCLSFQLQGAERKVLFFDLWKLDDWDHIELKQGQPRWVPECHYQDPAFLDRSIYFPSVWRDQESGKWRMIYSTKWSPFTMMIAESEDGLTWRPLPFENISPGEGQEKLAPNHLLTVPSGSGGAIYHDPNATDGYRYRIHGKQHGEPVFQRALKNPDHRYHDIATREGEKRYMGAGITIVSRDGLHWEIKTGGHWDWTADDWYPEPPVFVFWNPAIQRHVMACRPGWGDRRQCLRTSRDLKSWTAPQLQFQPDPLDDRGPIGMYGLPIIPVGNGAGFVGLLWIFKNASSQPVGSYNQFFGTMESELVYSYDGVRFFRGKRNPFIGRNPIPHPGCTQIRPTSIVEHGNQIYIYSEANRGAHGRERSEQRRHPDETLGSLTLHTLRKDGWMYLEPTGDWGRFQTKPFALFAPRIAINAQADYGEIHYQITDEKSQVIEGYGFENCLPMRGMEGLVHELKWKGCDLKNVLNRPIRLEFRLRQAAFYTIAMDHHFIDAHDMWLLKDGKPLPEKPRFDF